jgi:hypothetical protein
MPESKAKNFGRVAIILSVTKFSISWFELYGAKFIALWRIDLGQQRHFT